MKKPLFILMFLPILAALFCACSDDTAVGLDKSAFYLNFSAEYNDLTLAGKLSESENGGYKIVLSEPQTLAGFQAIYENESVKLSFAGLEYAFNKAELPDYAVVFTICDAIDSVLKNSPPVEKTQDGYLLSGIVGDVGYSLTLDSNYSPIALEIDGELPARIIFSK